MTYTLGRQFTLALACAAALAGCGVGPDSTTAPAMPARTLSSVVAQAGPPSAAASYYNVIQQIYVGYFGRPADPAGLKFYADRYLDAGAPTTIAGVALTYNSNANVRALLDSFGTSQESKDLYSGDTPTFVNAIYRNLFNRDSDDAGRKYWANLIDSGAVTRASAAISIMGGAQSTDATLIEVKTRAASAFTNYVNSPAMSSGYSGLAANAIVRTMLRTIDNNTDAAAIDQKISATVPTLFGTYSAPVAVSKISYPDSYTTPTPSTAGPAPSLCDLDPTEIRYPTYFIGNYPLPAISGAPLATDVLRGIDMKDVWDKANPSFIPGCTGSARTAFLKTLDRIKSLNGDYVTLYPWTFIKTGANWSIANPAELNTSTMDDTDLAWAVQQAHAKGIKVHWMNQIQGALDSSIPPATQENLDKFFAAFEPYMLERAAFLKGIGVDAMAVNCICFTYLEAPELDAYYEGKMAALLPKVRSAYDGKIRMKWHVSVGKNAAISNAVDYVTLPLWANVTPAEVPTLTTAKLKAKFMDSLQGLTTVFGSAITKPVIFELGVPSRGDYFTTGYAEETFCTSGFDTISGSASDCFQRRMATDFALQAMYYEAYLEAIKEQKWFRVQAIEAKNYWPVDGLTPSTTFPNLAISPRNKPAEGILKSWFARQ